MSFAIRSELCFPTAHVHRDLRPVLTAFVGRADELLLGQRRVEGLNGGDFRIVDVAEHTARHHAIGFSGESVRQFDQAAAIDRVAQRLRTLRPTSSFWNGSCPLEGTSIQIPG